MIMGAIAIGSILVLLAVNFIKIWNLYHKAEKYNWIWCVILFFLVLLAYAGLFNNLMLSLYAASQDELLEPAYFESSNYFLFGTVMMFMALAFTLGELMIFIGLIVFRSLEGPDDRVMDRKRGLPFIGKPY